MAPRARAAKAAPKPAEKPAQKAKAAPKSNVSAASKTKAKLPVPAKPASTKRKAVEDDESEAAKPVAKKSKSVAATKTASASATKKPGRKTSAASKKAASAASTTAKTVLKKAVAPKSTTSKTSTTTKPAAKKIAVPKSVASKASTSKSAPKKAAKKATPVPTTTTKAKAPATKRKAEDMNDAPPAKKAKDTAAMKKIVAAGKAAVEKEEKAKKAEEKKIAARKAAVLRTEKDEEKKAAAKKVAEEKKLAREIARILALPIINQPATTKLDVYVFGENSAGELGLGVGKDPNGKSVVDVKRPRINHNLFADKVGVVQIAVGGMHCVALTHDNKIYTWGVNDQGALGRATDSGPMKDMDDAAKEDSDDDSDAGDNLNASEATPYEIDTTNIPDGVKFASVYAGDSVSFALTTTGLVYGWGTFRGNDGILGFRVDDKQANVPKLIPELKDVTELACGTNHVLALTRKGKVFAWGAGEQNQLARRVMARSLENGLVPREFGLGRKKIVKIGAGDYHSFVIDDNGVKYAWGLNTFGQTGVSKKFDTDDIVMQPTQVPSLRDYDIKEIVGGAHHTIACTKDNKVLVWGRCDGHEAGVLMENLPKEDVFSDDKGPRFLEKPIVLEIEGLSVAAAGDTCLAVDIEGVAWAWGSSENFQTGTGQDDDVKEATEIANTAVNGKKLVACGLGGQFGVLCGVSSA